LLSEFLSAGRLGRAAVCGPPIGWPCGTRLTRLIDDIGENGVAASAAEAEERPVPDFTGTSLRTCS
jgi:hypothetical protein